jgi:hypothetical protein
MHSGDARGACIIQTLSCAYGTTPRWVDVYGVQQRTCAVSPDGGIQAGLQLLRRDDSDFS